MIPAICAVRHLVVAPHRQDRPLTRLEFGEGLNHDLLELLGDDIGQDVVASARQCSRVGRPPAESPCDASDADSGLEPCSA